MHGRLFSLSQPGIKPEEQNQRNRTMARPRRLTLSEFCDVVHDAVESLPESLHNYLENVVVDVQNTPDDADFGELKERGTRIEPDTLLLGLFIGRPLTEQSWGENHPNVIKIFRRPLEEICPTRGTLLRQIRATVIHELAHHFGFSEEDLDDFEQRVGGN
jgi:predicted Zn-dependent protease with MMP-like domain